MMHEVRSIPAAPRRVRLGPVLAHRWPMGALGGLLAGFGGLLSWMLFLAAGAKPSDQHRLDTEPTVAAKGRIAAIAHDPVVAPTGDVWEWVNYGFTFGDHDWPGHCMVPKGSCVRGDEVEVRLLPDTPRISVVAGGRLHFHRLLLAPEAWIGTVVVPGLLLLLGWLAGVFRLRSVLVHGDVSTGTVVSVRPVSWLLPEMVRIAYEFRDHRAALRHGRHWVRTHSELGARVLHQMHTGWFDPLPVLHDRRFPQFNRMLLARDFLPSTSPHPHMENVG
ncbi:MAG: hypothetical protein KDE27_17360 [Planctomycetes bacterium]|nr:hypothetical protein [Planctomycetota bacterium]